MTKLAITIHRTFDGKVTVLYAGDNADEAFAAWKKCDEVGDVAVIRQPPLEYAKRLRPQDVKQAAAPEDAASKPADKPVETKEPPAPDADKPQSKKAASKPADKPKA